MSSFKTAPQQ